ncbi:lipoprotein-releasing system ATP-binding protein [Ekhidna lutea]|uniref:Lipoprotein-releasing system ATP-binding protein n=2 Tax=Ekhidna lutea TaxID=447679 RepID=A0A239LA51_EKHLU|nr:lipoprotein-releasing system ATP-binding protein [Ekhidna lutea]
MGTYNQAEAFSVGLFLIDNHIFAAMLKAEKIHKSYNGLHVLRGVELSISKEEVVSIVGASGAGKSTLLHILGTLDTPDSGSVWLNGTAVSSLNQKKMAQFRNEQIGFIFQFHNLFPEFTALENICMPAYIKGTKNPEKKALELLDILGLKERKEHKPSELSGGEQQRVSVARALINDPSIVFADEPSGNLDSKSADDLHKLFFDLRNQIGQTFVIVTHNMELAGMADRKLEIKDGIITT